jgi:hypothetical protein
MISSNIQKSFEIVLDCQICFEEYHMHTKKPMVLDCGHSICQNCLRNILSNPRKKCPFDNKDLKKPFDQYPINWSYIDIITSKNIY